MDGISSVLQRIAAIEKRFAPNPTEESNFADYMKTANNQLSSGEKATAVQSASSASAWKNVPAASLEGMIYAAATKYGVDPKLATAVATVESGLTADAVSPAVAVGVMQLMPDTAKALGVRNLSDPRENIDGGVHYLKDLLTMFQGDARKALAAYNAGPQAVKNYGGVPPYRETQNYVSKVLSLYNQ